MNVNVRHMMRQDFGFALDIAEQERWGYDIADLERLVRLFPEGCLLAEGNSARAGWVLVASYGTLAWIGSLIIRKDLRGKGIGRALLSYAVRHARERGAKTIGVYSYTQSEGFYERLKFKRDCEFEQLEAHVEEPSSGAPLQHIINIDEVAEFDRRYFRGDRKPLLRALHQEFPGLMVLQKDTHVLGYIAGKSFTGGTAEIGPWVCEEKRTEVAERLLASELSQLASKRVSLAIPSQNTEARRIVEKYGFRTKQRIVRMFLGDPLNLPLTSGIYAAAGLDIG